MSFARNPPVSSEYWLWQMFAVRAACDGGIVRRKVRDVDRFVGRQAFLAEMERRGFHVVENAGQYVVFCNHETVRLLV